MYTSKLTKMDFFLLYYQEIIFAICFIPLYTRSCLNEFAGETCEIAQWIKVFAVFAGHVPPKFSCCCSCLV